MGSQANQPGNGASTSTGITTMSLKTKISLKGNQPTVVIPFYGINPELPQPSDLLGSIDLVSRFGLNSQYHRYCIQRKAKEDLASFLPHICGVSHLNAPYKKESSLKALIEKPPISTNIKNLTSDQMTGFKLVPGQVSINCRLFDLAGGISSLQMLESPRFSESDISKRNKRSLEDFEEIERKVKRHKGEDREKEKKAKKKKKEKKKKSELSQKTHRKDSP